MDDAEEKNTSFKPSTINANYYSSIHALLPTIFPDILVQFSYF